MTNITPQQMRELADDVIEGRTTSLVTSLALRDAADEAERWRGVIENAPHQLDCNTEPGGIGDPSICTCWKADAL